MKKILLVSGLALILGLGSALAQNITRSVQGSQDPRGPIGWDTSNSMYFPGHINAYGQQTTTPTLSCTTAAASNLFSGSTDVAGKFTPKDGNTCQLTFGSPFNVAPICIANASSGTTSFPTTSASTVLMSVSNLTTGTVVNYLCIGNQ